MSIDKNKFTKKKKLSTLDKLKILNSPTEGSALAELARALRQNEAKIEMSEANVTSIKTNSGERIELVDNPVLKKNRH